VLYVERMVATGSLSRCAVCGKLIRWPEEARLYAESKSVPISRVEHVEHSVLEGAARAD